MVKEFLNETVPRRFAEDPRLAQRVLGAFQLQVAGAGTWGVEMVGAARVVRGGTDYPSPVVISLSQQDFARLLNDPRSVWELFSAGGIELSDVCRGITLLEAFFPGTLRRAVPAPLYRAVFPLLAANRRESE